MRRDLHIVDDSMMPYYQDVYDHVLRATEWTESLRDLVATTVETNLTIQANRMNLIMKKVTSWAAIIAVPTAITGFYGQNLPYPGFGTRRGSRLHRRHRDRLRAALPRLQAQRLALTSRPEPHGLAEPADGFASARRPGLRRHKCRFS